MRYILHHCILVCYFHVFLFTPQLFSLIVFFTALLGVLHWIKCPSIHYSLCRAGVSASDDPHAILFFAFCCPEHRASDAPTGSGDLQAVWPWRGTPGCGCCTGCRVQGLRQCSRLPQWSWLRQSSEGAPSQIWLDQRGCVHNQVGIVFFSSSPSVDSRSHMWSWPILWYFLYILSQ